MRQIENPIYYKLETENIWVTVTPFFLEEQSSVSEGIYLWGYMIKIENQSEVSIKLLERFWDIIDQNGLVTNVSGKGVIGEQPYLKPGESFEYASGVPLTTPSGLMVGYYVMQLNDGTLFRVEIPTFSLDSKYTKVTLN